MSKNEKVTSLNTEEKNKKMEKCVPDSSYEGENCHDLLNINYSFTENSDLYVISVEGKPFCYVKDVETANDKMWSIIREYSFNNFSDWMWKSIKITDNGLELMGSYKFFIISYSQKLFSISYSKVMECT